MLLRRSTKYVPLPLMTASLCFTPASKPGLESTDTTLTGRCSEDPLISP